MDPAFAVQSTANQWWSCWLMLVGCNVTFLPMHLTGLRGRVRRGVTWPEGIGFDGLNLLPKP